MKTHLHLLQSITIPFAGGVQTAWNVMKHHEAKNMVEHHETLINRKKTRQNTVGNPILPFGDSLYHPSIWWLGDGVGFRVYHIIIRDYRTLRGHPCISCSQLTDNVVKAHSPRRPTKERSRSKRYTSPAVSPGHDVLCDVWIGRMVSRPPEKSGDLKTSLEFCEFDRLWHNNGC